MEDIYNIIDEIIDEAHRLWQLQEYDTAADLFLKAASIEKEAAANRLKWASADQSILYELRAAFCLWESGQFKDALEYLNKVRGFDWMKERLWGDRRDSDTAYTYMLVTMATLGDKSSFSSLFKEAVDNGIRIDYPFSSIYNNQKKLILACMQIGNKKALKTILKNISSEGVSTDLELKLAVSQGKQYLRNNRWKFWK